MVPNTSHIHSHGFTGRPPLRADLAVLPPPQTLSTGMRPEQTGPLRREQWRPKAVLLRRRRGGGRLPVVSPRCCFWEYCHTNPHPQHPPGSDGEVALERHSYDQAAGGTVMDELILADVQKRGEPDP